MYPLFLQDSPVLDPTKLLEQAQNVTPESGGYTFAISVLVVVIFGLLYFVRMLWVTIQKQNDKYDELAQSTTKLLTEVNIKMDNSDKIDTKLTANHEKIIAKIDSMMEVVKDGRGCNFNNNK